MIGIFESTFEQDIKNTEVEMTFKNGETLRTLREKGVELLKLFHSKISPQKIVAIEFRFSVRIPDILNGGGDLPIKLVGYFDLVESDKDGTNAVVELKTSAQRFSSLRLEYDQQSTVYSYAIKGKGPGK